MFAVSVVPVPPGMHAAPFQDLSYYVCLCIYTLPNRIPFELIWYLYFPRPSEGAGSARLASDSHALAFNLMPNICNVTPTSTDILFSGFPFTSYAHWKHSQGFLSVWTIARLPHS